MRFQGALADSRARLAKGVRGGGGRGELSPRESSKLKLLGLYQGPHFVTLRSPSWADLGSLRDAAAHEGRKAFAFRRLWPLGAVLELFGALLEPA